MAPDKENPAAGAMAGGASDGDHACGAIGSDHKLDALLGQGFLCDATAGLAERSDAIAIAAWRRLMSYEAQYRRAELMGREPVAVREREKAAAARRASTKLRRCRTCGHLEIRSAA